MKWFAKFFESSREDDPNHSAAITKIEACLQNHSREEAQFLACIGLLAAKVAHTDDVISAGEREKIRQIFMNQMMLPEALAGIVTTVAVNSHLAHSIEHHIVIRRMNEIATHEQRLAIVRSLFYVACAEGITETESDQIGFIAASLLLSRAEFIAIRSEFSQHRSILQDTQKP